MNFIRQDHAKRFQRQWEGIYYFDEEHRQCGQPIEVLRAKVQGFNANKASFKKNNPNSEFGPLFFPEANPRKGRVVPLLKVGT